MFQKISIGFSLILLTFFAAVQARAESCGLELNVTESNADGNPVRSVSATATNLVTKKSFKASFLEGYPVFGNLREGTYRITVKKFGYKTTVKRLNLDCRSADEDQNIVTVNVFLRKGSGKQIYNQPMSRRAVPTSAVARPKTTD